MKKNRQCPKCDSKRILGNVAVLGGGSTGELLLVATKQKLLFLGKSATAQSEAWVCAACGYTEFYSKISAEFIEVHEKMVVRTKSKAVKPATA
jgi:predicted nucleic-acid-binding Zn-ribbon protein